MQYKVLKSFTNNNLTVQLVQIPAGYITPMFNTLTRKCVRIPGVTGWLVTPHSSVAQSIYGYAKHILITNPKSVIYSGITPAYAPVM